MLLFAISSGQFWVDLNKVTFIRLKQESINRFLVIDIKDIHWTLFKTSLFKT